MRMFDSIEMKFVKCFSVLLILFGMFIRYDVRCTQDWPTRRHWRLEHRIYINSSHHSATTTNMAKNIKEKKKTIYIRCIVSFEWNGFIELCIMRIHIANRPNANKMEKQIEINNNNNTKTEQKTETIAYNFKHTFWLQVPSSGRFAHLVVHSL